MALRVALLGLLLHTAARRACDDGACLSLDVSTPTGNHELAFTHGDDVFSVALDFAQQHGLTRGFDCADAACVARKLASAMKSELARANVCAHVSPEHVTDAPMTMSERDARRLDAIIAKRSRVLERPLHYWEWGAGASTSRYALSPHVLAATTVVHDACWCDAVAREFASARLAVRCVPNVSDASGREAYVAHVLDARRAPGRAHNHGGLDVVLVAGLLRAECALAVLPALARDAIVAVSDWPDRHAEHETLLRWYALVDEPADGLALLQARGVRSSVSPWPFAGFSEHFAERVAAAVPPVREPRVTVLVLSFDRPASLGRALQSVADAATRRCASPSSCEAITDLVISVDRAASVGDIDREARRRAVVATARAFQWPFGRKDVRVQLSHLGLARQWFQNLPGESDGSEFFLILEDDTELSRWSLALLSRLDAQLEVSRDDRVAAVCLTPLERPAGERFFWYERFANYTCEWAPVWRTDALILFKRWLDSNFGVITPLTGSPPYDRLARDALDVPSAWTLRFVVESGLLVGTFNLQRADADGEFSHYLAVNHREEGEHVIQGAGRRCADEQIEEAGWARLLLRDERLLPTAAEWSTAREWALSEPDARSPSVCHDCGVDWWIAQLAELQCALSDACKRTSNARRTDGVVVRAVDGAHDRASSEELGIVVETERERRAERGRPIFVHVGKTCGSFVARALPSDAFDRVHRVPVGPRERVRAVSVRDPIERLNSAFHYRRAGYTHMPLQPAERSLFACFEDVDQLAAALDDDTCCGWLARDALRPSDRMTHITENHAFYVGDWLRANPRASLAVIRAERCEDDVRALLAVDELPFRPRPVSALHGAMDSDRVNVEKPALSQHARAKLLSRMRDEYAVYDELLARGGIGS